MKEVRLPSGAVLKIGSIPFDPSNELKKAVMVKVLQIPITSKNEVLNVSKDMLCLLLSDERVEQCLWKCMERCLYSDSRGELKIDKGTFEPFDCRQDFIDVQAAVAEECLMPFSKGLFALLQRVLALVGETSPQ